MGVGLIGRVDPNQGIWLQIDPSRTQPIALAKELSDIYGIPCHIDNDVKVPLALNVSGDSDKYPRTLFILM